MKRFTTIAILISAAAMCGCTTTQQGAGLGTLIGAGTGAIIGHQKDKAAEGALIGAAAGAAGGALIGNAMETKFCPTCGAGYTGGTMNCPKDGTPLRMKGQPTQATADTTETASEAKSAAPEMETAKPRLNKFCSVCGAEYQDNVKYCSKDGTELLYKK